MAAPIFDNLNKYKHLDRYPFHMPGHKQGRGLYLGDVLKMDITEIQGFDNLHSPHGIIEEAQILCAKTFGADESFFIVNGSSAGIIASILTVCNDGDTIIVARNCHRSVYSGLIVSGAVPAYIMPEIVSEYNITGGVSIVRVSEAIASNPNAKAVIITSPTYEGFTSDIEKIADITHKNNMILIVDEAHGAHMKFHGYFPTTALECGADIVIQSVHKTLTSMTQTSILHVRNGRVDIPRLKVMLTIVQTSSPSYILMASIDKCRDDIDNFGNEYFNNYVERLINFRNHISKLNHINIIGDEVMGRSGVFQVDKCKLVFYSDYIQGEELERILIEKYNIQLEASSLRHIIAMTSLADDDTGFKRLETALNEIDGALSKKLEKCDNINISFAHMRLTPRQAVFGKKKTVEFKKSIGNVSAEFIISYPPGIPIIVPGEIITENCYDIICKNIILGTNVIGMNDETLKTIQIIN